ncbi:hypothetical protein PHYBOEH_011371 [Phytophthora boehmeriae]|uniref:DNA repair metallo-beta-lactamase domain-containing protein n=1 Tax=Phytophthora boehmeriae TaxID=109152 RepID=A0A8T1WWS1_9STRA|nr:hypothetical protein PHYBOEH_011371 [Phytophthora boehmeriae]
MDETESVAPTQVSSSTTQPDPMHCVVCSMEMTQWEISEREAHLNACLDASEQRYDCPTCGKELSDCDERQRMEHVNLCLDKTLHTGQATAITSSTNSNDYSSGSNRNVTTDEKDMREAKTQAQGQEEDDGGEGEDGKYVCKICGANMSDFDLMKRIRHVKQCGLKFGVRPEDMGETENAEAIVARLDEKGAKNAFALMMQSSTPARASRIDTSNVFDVMMRGSKTEAVLNARKRPITSNRSFGRFGRPTQRQRLACPDYKWIRGTKPPYIVDGFQYACKETSTIYFLTHFHSDHYGGLGKSFDCGVVYCNEVTANLVVQELGVESKYVHPVAMNTPVLIGDVQVTFMDANHCPGSAIILFRLKDGKAYLHTGDFRFHRKMLEYTPLQEYIPAANQAITYDGKRNNAKRLDGVYLDTTYCDPKYTFPTQQTAINHALTLIDKHFNQEKVLFLFGSYTIGKERLFMEIARKFQRKVCVSVAKLSVISTFGWPAEEMRLLTTESGATNLHVVRMQDLQMDNLAALLMKHRLRFRHIVAFRPTGWAFSAKSTRSISTCCTDPSGKIRVYGIPYSEHSSFAELCEFVQVVNPQVIIPTVNCSTSRHAKKQVDALRQVAFHNILVLFKQQQERQQDGENGEESHDGIRAELS